jgi:tRNA(His) guanylyltransferase
MALTDPTENPLDFLGGDRFKGYEADAQSFLESQPFAALRVDGKGFSKLTRSKGYAVPYDYGFMGIMDHVAQSLLKLVDGACVAYVQSDEVSVIFKPSGPPGDSNWWFGGKTQKLVSLSAAQASASFSLAEALRSGSLDSEALFDSRLIPLQSEEDAEEYLRWRRFDAQKNSISMAASSLFSHRELDGVSSKDRAEMLQGTELERLPDGFFNGRLHYRLKTLGKAWNPALEQEVEVERTRLVSEPADREAVENVLPQLLVHRAYSTANPSGSN